MEHLCNLRDCQSRVGQEGGRVLHAPAYHILFGTVTGMGMKKLNKVFFTHAHKGGQFADRNVLFDACVNPGQQFMNFQHRGLPGLLVERALCAKIGEERRKKRQKLRVHLQWDGGGIVTGVKECLAECIGEFANLRPGVDARGII